MFPPQESRQLVKKIAVSRYKTIEALTNRSHAGNFLVHPQHPPLAGRGSKGQKNSLGTAEHLAIRRDELYGLNEIFPRNFWKLTCHILKRRVLDSTFG